MNNSEAEAKADKAALLSIINTQLKTWIDHHNARIKNGKLDGESKSAVEAYVKWLEDMRTAFSGTTYTGYTVKNSADVKVLGEMIRNKILGNPPAAANTGNRLTTITTFVDTQTASVIANTVVTGPETGPAPTVTPPNWEERKKLIIGHWERIHGFRPSDKDLANYEAALNAPGANWTTIITGFINTPPTDLKKHIDNVWATYYGGVKPPPMVFQSAYVNHITHDEITNKAIEDFKKENPGVKVPTLPGSYVPPVIVTPATGGPGTSGTTAAPTPAPTIDHSDYIKQIFKSYVGRAATQNDLNNWNSALNDNTATKNDMIMSLARTQEAKDYRAKVMAGDKGEFDAVVTLVWRNYLGKDPTAEDIAIHSAALKGGMTLPDFQANILTAPAALTHIADSPITEGMHIAMNNTMSNSVAAASMANTFPYVSVDNIVPTAAGVVSGIINPSPPATSTAPAPTAGANDDYIKMVFKHYMGRPPTQTELKAHNDNLAGVGNVPGGVSKANFLISIATDPGAKAYQNTRLQGDKGEFDAVIKQVWNDYLGRNPDADDLRIHGAALKSGMTIDDFRSIMSNVPGAKDVNYDARLTQNYLMHIAVQASNNAGTYFPSATFGTPLVVAPSTPSAPAPAPDETRAPEAPPVPTLSQAQKDAMSAIWQQYVGRPADDGDYAIHGPAILSGAKTMDQLKDEVVISPAAVQYRLDTVYRIFRTIVGRDPSQTDIDIHTASLARGTSVQAIEDLARANAAADQAAHAALVANQAMIQRIFNQYLGHGANDTDLTIHAGKTEAQLAYDVGNSPEALQIMAPANYKYIRNIYKNYLGATPNRDEVKAWNDALTNPDPNARVTRIGMLHQVVNSDHHKYFQGQMNYANEHDATINGIWGKFNLGTASPADLKIHGSAMKGGMTSSDLEGYVAQAVGMPGYSTEN